MSHTISPEKVIANLQERTSFYQNLSINFFIAGDTPNSQVNADKANRYSKAADALIFQTS